MNINWDFRKNVNLIIDGDKLSAYDCPFMDMGHPIPPIGSTLKFTSNQYDNNHNCVNKKYNVRVVDMIIEHLDQENCYSFARPETYNITIECETVEE